MAATKQRTGAKKTPTPRTRPKPKPKAVHVLPQPPVEVDVSTRCAHGCFAIALKYHSVRWNLPGTEACDMDAEGKMIFHNHFEGEDFVGECETTCFEDGV